MAPMVIEISNLRELVLLFVGLSTLIGAFFAVSVYLLKGKFVTREDCKIDRRDCKGNVCHKIDELIKKIDEIETKRDQAKSEQIKIYLWLDRSLNKIAAASGTEIENMPTK